MKLPFVTFISLAISLSAFAGETRRPLYKLICDPLNGAEFLKFNGNNTQCAFLELTMAEYLKENDQPCNETKIGRYLKKFLGRACESKDYLMVSVETYRKSVSCENTNEGQITEGLIGRTHCFSDYTLIP